MNLISHAMAFGLGYTLGRPDGRRALGRLGTRATRLARRPEVVELRERGWDLAAERAAALRSAVGRRSRRAGSGEAVDAQDRGGHRPEPGRPGTVPTDSDTATPPSGFGGRTVAEDSHDLIVGRRVPPPASPDAAADRP